MSAQDHANDIAIIGFGARFPGALTPEEYWRNLRAGTESIVRLSEDELLMAGVSKADLTDPQYVPAAARLDRMDHFDADFFGLSPKEGAIMDPQHRQFLEACWEALEDAAHVPSSFDGAIGVFAGCGMNSYFINNVLSNKALVRDVGLFLLRHTGNDKDFLATRVSYSLDLRGPALNVQTACSTSLVATHLAAQHLLSGECDLALAGGSTIEFPHGQGYHYIPGEILSPDGHCRAFDRDALGTVFGSGTGVVVLRRLQDALDDGDRIYAVLKGSAVNNDGSQKVGYLAPSVDGQASCVAEALAIADVDASSIGYIECHGTGTAMGDPIEIAALTQAFRLSTDDTGFCRIGSVKTNIGHLDTAAGAASLIKTALSLYHGEIPASLNFQHDNPVIEIDATPFVVNHTRREWLSDGGLPRRAGVNSLGVGGTNAFAVLEEAPNAHHVGSQLPRHLLVVSGKTRAALDGNTKKLARHLRDHPTLDLGDVAWTLTTGRHPFKERRVLAARDIDEAVALLETNDERRVFTHTLAASTRSVAFVFPGGGAQYPRMAVGLHDSESEFRAHLDNGLDLLLAEHGIDLAPLLLHPEPAPDAARQLERPSLQLPSIFIVEYAMAQLLLSKGVRPDALLGHSLGENTAACVAGTMSFRECLGLVVLRGALLERSAGGMTVVAATPLELADQIAELGLDLAVVNAPDLCVVSGEVSALDEFEARMRRLGNEPQRVKIGSAAHSRLLDPVLDEFRTYLRSITLAAPTIPWVSNVTGTWITTAQATDPDYWVDQLRSTVRFADCVATLAAAPTRLFLEVGPGTTLSALVRMNPAFRSPHAALPSLRHADDPIDDEAMLLTALGRLWAEGCKLDLSERYSGETRHRVGLPTYDFQSVALFLPPGRTDSEPVDAEAMAPDRVDDELKWWWKPVWRNEDVDDSLEDSCTWLVVHDQQGVGDELGRRLLSAGNVVINVRFGDSYQRLSDVEYVLASEEGRYGYDQLVRDLVQRDSVPQRVAHLALLATREEFRPGLSYFHRNQELGMLSLFHLAQAWAAATDLATLHIVVASAGAQYAVDTDVVPWPEQATVLGPAMVIPRELPGVTVTCVDVDPRELHDRTGWQTHADRALADLQRRLRGVRRSDAPRGQREVLLDALHRELLAPSTNQVLALRGDRRLVRKYASGHGTGAGRPAFRRGSVVLVTGGLGGIGLAVAEHLAGEYGARLVLLSRSTLPPRERWAELRLRLGDEHPLSQRLAALERLDSARSEYLIIRADVTDVDDVHGAIEQAMQRFGALDVVIHAAGTVNDDLIAIKDESDIERVLAPKVYGTIVLDEAVRHLEPELFVVFGSTSTAVAPAGQVDYVAANSFLNSFVHSRSNRGHTRYLAVNWGIWRGVGLADAARRAVLEPGELSSESLATQPLFDTRSVDELGTVRLTSHWRAADEWFLDQHRTAEGVPLLPGAMYPELIRQALVEVLNDDTPFTVHDLVFEQPLVVPEGARADVMTSLTPSGDGWRVEVTSGGVRTATATVERGTGTPRPAVDLAAADAECPTPDPNSTSQFRHLRVGPRWDVLGEVRRSDGCATARIAAHAMSDVSFQGLHPAMLDVATGYAMSLIPGYSGNVLWVPLTYRTMRVHREIPDAVISMVTLQGSDNTAGMATFDVTVTDDEGNLVVEVEGFSITRLSGTLNIDGPATPFVTAHGGGAVRHVSPSERALLHNIERGIDREAGVRALDRLMREFDESEVVVSSLDLGALQRQASAVAVSMTAVVDNEMRFDRPDLAVEYAEPRNDVERTLAEMWRDLLGVEQIGIDDDFFDLGGHSIIAVRLFARMRQHFDVDLPISTLFEAPTIAACAALIAQSMPSIDEQSTKADGEPSTGSTRSFVHLVAMHHDPLQPGTPLFVVAGMFGNVLNLRHLAHQVSDRPFYGLQARGLFGEQQPHETFEEMASDYLDEIMRVQPQGPYLLAGFSGGGIAAFEIARQLRAKGERVATLVLLDTPAPTPRPTLTAMEKVRLHGQNLRQHGVGYVKRWFEDRAAWREAQHDRARLAGQQIDEGSLHSTAVEGAFLRSLARYRLQPIDVPLTLYRPRREPAHVFGPGRAIDHQRNFLFDDNDWGAYAPSVDVTIVPGNHDTMVLEPNVRVLAGHLRAAIQRTLLPNVVRSPHDRP